MSLINIEYGSLASSEILNKNFEYLEKKIEENTSSIMTSISSILSNIATINSRLGEQAELIDNNNSESMAKLEEYKNKTKIFVQQSSIIPHWNGCTAINIGTLYNVKANGYILIIPDENNDGNLKINTVTLAIENQGLVVLPVKENDVISSTISIKYAYFIPATELSFEGF